MEHFLRIAFGIVTLFACLHATPIPQTDANLYYLQKFVTCPSDSAFYAPTNVKEACIAAALTCVMKELNGTVTEECKDPKNYIDSTVEYFELKLEERQHEPTNSSECDCHEWPTVSFSEFLNKTKTLLELNDAASPARTDQPLN